MPRKTGERIIKTKIPKTTLKEINVEDINRQVYPNYEKDLSKLLDTLQYNPGEEIVKAIRRIDTIVEGKQNTLTPKELLEYTKMRMDADKILLPYVYDKKSIKHETNRLNVTTSYGDVIDRLHEKRLGKDSIEGSIEGQWDEV